jgi:MFS transporter, FHS family, L-fucose permease
MENQQPNRTLATVVLVFFFWGFVAASNDILIPVFKSSLGLKNWQAQLVNFAFYMAYTIGSVLYVSLAYFKKKDIVSLFGYQKSVALGLLISALGTLMFIPAAEFNSFWMMISGLFIVGLGFSLQQTAANPFAIALGKPETGSQRLSLAGGINNIGTTIGPLIVAYAIFGGVAADEVDVTIDHVKIPYLWLGVAFVATASIFYLSGRKQSYYPEKTTTNSEEGKFHLRQYPQLFLGMLAIFFYVGVEVATGGHIGEFMKQEIAGFDDKSITPYVSLYWASLMIGRWTSAATVFSGKKEIRLLLKVVLPYAAFGIFLFATKQAGHQIDAFYTYLLVIPVIIFADLLSKDNPARQLLLFSILGITALFITMFAEGMIGVFALLSVGMFCSTLWPCIFTLATKGLGQHTTRGSSLLVMMIMGGAIVSLSQGFLADVASIGVRFSFFAGVICFGYLAFYAVSMLKRFKLESH